MRTIPLEFLSGKEETGASREGRLFTELVALLDANLRGTRGPGEGNIMLGSHCIQFRSGLGKTFCQIQVLLT